MRKPRRAKAKAVSKPQWTKLVGLMKNAKTDEPENGWCSWRKLAFLAGVLVYRFCEW